MTGLTSAGVSQTPSLAQNAPFTATEGPNPAVFPATVPFPRWQRARDRACAALLAGETRLLLTGPPGTGKTALVQEIARILRYAGWRAAVRAAGLPPEGGVVALTGHQAVLLIDEADRLSDPELHDLEAGPHGALVLAGLDPIGLRWEAGARISLSPLSRAEAHDYAAQWLNMAGQKERFAAEAVERVIEVAGGIPRLLSSLLGASIWMAGPEGVGPVTRAHVNDAAALRTCFLEEEDGSHSNAETTASPPLAVRHQREQAETDVSATKTSVLIERSDDVSDTLALQQPALPPSRSMLIATLASCLAIVAMVGGGAITVWPNETKQVARFVSEIIAEQGLVNGVRGAVEIGLEGATALPKDKGELKAEPIAEAAQLAAESAASPTGQPPTTTTPSPAESATVENPVLESAVGSPALQHRSPERDTSVSEADTSHWAVPVEQHSTAAAERADANESGAVPQQQHTASIEIASGMPSPSPTLSAPLPSTAVGSRPAEVSNIPSNAQSTSPALPDPPALAHLETSTGPTAALETAKPLSPGNPSSVPVAALLGRGDALISIGDIAAARIVYQRAATLGSGRAATATGRTYDPRFLQQIGAVGVVADPDAAAEWYQKGASLGDRDAPLLLGGMRK